MANFSRGEADFAADVDAIEVGSEAECVRKEGVTEEDGHAVAPSGVGCLEVAACFGTVDDVVVDEGSHVDELEDDADFEVIGVELAGGASDEDGEGGADAFAVGVTDVGNVRFDLWIEGVNLFTDQRLDLL